MYLREELAYAKTGGFGMKLLRGSFGVRGTRAGVGLEFG
jgi:hypothetical protein